MVSSAIVDVIANSLPGFTKGVDLFAESGSGDKFVVASVTGDNGVLQGASAVKFANVGLMLYGYSMIDGMTYSRQITDLLRETVNYSYDFVSANYNANSAYIIRYNIKTVKVETYPIHISSTGAFTANFLVGYSEDIIS